VQVEVDDERSALIVARGIVRVLVNLSDSERCFEVATEEEVFAYPPDQVERLAEGLVLSSDSVAVVRLLQ